MLNSSDIKDIKFSKAMGGYKQDEVDVLLDKVESDYEYYEHTVRDLQATVDSLRKEIDDYKNSQSSIQNVLLSAQKLADQIVEDAKAKSDTIISEAKSNVEVISREEKELAASFEEKAAKRKLQVEKELQDTYKNAEIKKEGIEAATNDAVERQQLLFDKLKLEVVSFKNELKKKYKEHLELLQSIPDEVPMDPKMVADALSFAFENAPDVNSFIPQANNMDSDFKPETCETEKTEVPSNGFTVEDMDTESEEEDV